MGEGSYHGSQRSNEIVNTIRLRPDPVVAMAASDASADALGGACDASYSLRVYFTKITERPLIDQASDSLLQTLINPVSDDRDISWLSLMMSDSH